MASPPSGITDPSWIGGSGVELASESGLFSGIAASVTTTRAPSRQHFAPPIMAPALHWAGAEIAGSSFALFTSKRRPVMNRTHRRSTGIMSVACLGIALAACSGQGGEVTGQSVDPLLGGGPGGGFASPGAACIEASCSAQLSSLEAELKTLHTETEAAFACVQQSKCLALFWEADDAGHAAAKDAVLACIAACDADAGLDVDAAESEVTVLAQSLEGCVATSCASTCPGAGGGYHPGAPTNDDASAANEDGGATSDDAGATNEDAGSGNGTGTGNGTGPGSGSGWNGFPDSGADDAGGNPHSWW
jgi:hypothetical protein